MFRKVAPWRIAVDAALAGSFVMFMMLSMPTVNSMPQGLSHIWVVLLLGIALVFRRLAPPLALGFAWAAALIQVGSGLSIVFADTAILAVLYSVARYGSKRLRTIGLVSVGLGSLVAVVYLGIVEPARYGSPGSAIEIGTRLVMLTVSSIAVLGLSWTLGLLMHTRDQNKAAERSRIEEQALRHVAEQETVIEQERNQIARDMHDVVAHSLAVVIAQADGARYAAAANPAAAPAALETIAATARESLAEVRALLTAMRHQEAEGPQPSMADLPPLLAQFRDAGLPVIERSSGVPAPLGRGHEMAAYRIIQEALTNALRHGAPGGPAVLDLIWTPTGLDLVVHNPVPAGSDPGPGGGHGLPGMRERAALAGGQLSAEHHGTRFRVAARIPSALSGTHTQPIPAPIAPPQSFVPTATEEPTP